MSSKITFLQRRLKNTVKKGAGMLGYAVLRNSTLQAMEAEISRLKRVESGFPVCTDLPSILRDRQIAFLHIAKTAGSSFTELLRGVFATIPSIQLGAWEFDEHSPKQLGSYGLLMGHFSFHHSRKFRPNPFLITFLRDPVERVISSYYFLRSWKGYINDQNRIEVEAAKGLSFHEFLLSERLEVRRICSNQQTYCLGADWRDPRTADPDILLRTALSNLDRFSFVGITEAYDQGVRLLFNQMQVPLPQKLSAVNVTPARPRKSDVAIEDLDLIKSLNALDDVLYKKAVERYQETVRSVTADAGLGL